ncbi:MAG: hypothetical protein HYV14_13010 [Elusimicrobia bacterium]|nr:hypothetical protein [Elusimicrobiota bacterium]
MKKTLCAVAAAAALFPLRAPAQVATLESALAAAPARAKEGDFPQRPVCEAALTRSMKWASPVFSAADGKPFRGFGAVGYSASRSVGVSLVLLTDSAAYYYYESCDICADVDRVDLKTYQVTSAVAAHSVRCEDLVRFKTGAIAYDACPAAQPKTAALRCTGKSADSAFTGELDLGMLALKTSRAEGASPRLGSAIDSRCDALPAAYEGSLNYEVTPRGYWGEDVLQLPQAALRSSGKFKANLHTCQYDGDWSASQDEELECTLTPR